MENTRGEICQSNLQTAMRVTFVQGSVVSCSDLTQISIPQSLIPVQAHKVKKLLTIRTLDLLDKKVCVLYIQNKISSTHVLPYFI